MNTGNRFAAVPSDLRTECFERLAGDTPLRIECIVSRRHRWPAFDDGRMLELGPGDYVDIRPHCRHRAEWTVPDTETAWLAVHY